jgi:hypothetical protein
MNDCCSGWRIVSLLRVIKRFENHEDAAAWYRNEKIEVPSNCFVKNNSPKPFDHTHGIINPKIKRKLCFPEEHERAVRLWDRSYKLRIQKQPEFLACHPIFLELQNPPQISEKDMLEIFGRIPGTQNPPKVSKYDVEKLMQLAGVKFSEQANYRCQQSPPPN